MNFSNRIDESLSFFKAFQMVITIGARTSKIAPRSSRYPPGSNVWPRAPALALKAPTPGGCGGAEPPHFDPGAQGSLTMA